MPALQIWTEPRPRSSSSLARRGPRPARIDRHGRTMCRSTPGVVKLPTKNQIVQCVDEDRSEGERRDSQPREGIPVLRRPPLGVEECHAAGHVGTNLHLIALGSPALEDGSRPCCSSSPLPDAIVAQSIGIVQRNSLRTGGIRGGRAIDETVQAGRTGAGHSHSEGARAVDRQQGVEFGDAVTVERADEDAAATTGNPMRSGRMSGAAASRHRPFSARSMRADALG